VGKRELASLRWYEGDLDEKDTEGAEDRRTNDPLTRTDVKAPRVPFGGEAPSED
jgi:hypothetical protein